VRDANFGGVLQKKGMRSGRRLAWLAGTAAVATAVVACIELKGSDGSDCLRNDDCQSGVCSQLVCVPVPPVLELEAGPDAGADGAIDGAPAPATDGAITTPNDGTAPVDGTVADAFVADGPATPADSATDAIDETSPPDAPSDAPPDAPADARDDAGENG
jgi:hypothetical protein